MGTGLVEFRQRAVETKTGDKRTEEEIRTARDEMTTSRINNFPELFFRHCVLARDVGSPENPSFFKEGDRADPTTYRAIHFLCISSGILARTADKR